MSACSWLSGVDCFRNRPTLGAGSAAVWCSARQICLAVAELGVLGVASSPMDGAGATDGEIANEGVAGWDTLCDEGAERQGRDMLY